MYILQSELHLSTELYFLSCAKNPHIVARLTDQVE